MLLKEIKNIYLKELDAMYPKEEVNSFFHMAIEHYLGLQRFVLAVQPNLTVTKIEEQPLFEALAQLKLHRPIQYIIGKAHFMDMDFSVDESVLIPRPETEELVRWVVDELSGKSEALSVLDIGTGSGCIAVSLAKNLPNCEVHAFDVSVEALKVARKNAKANGADVTFADVDILDAENPAASYDIIISNPPYVRDQEKKDIHKNVMDHEPELALFVSDGNPLIFYEAIAKFGKKNLTRKGSLYLEINQYLPKETEELLRNHNFSEIELRKDMFGNDRMIKCVN